MNDPNLQFTLSVLIAYRRIFVSVLWFNPAAGSSAPDSRPLTPPSRRWAGEESGQKAKLRG